MSKRASEESKSSLSQGANKRMKGTTIVKPICFGSLAWVNKSEDPLKTHKWTVFIRGCQNEDISYYIKRVIFNLHSDFEKPKRIIDKAPFEVTECGWGEFEIIIKIYFHDSNEKSVELFQPLRLFPAEGVILAKKKPVVAEQYDEIVFNDPTESFLKKLKKYTPRRVVLPHPLSGLPTSQFDEQIEIQKFIDAKKKVNDEIEQLKEKLIKIEKEIGIYTGQPLNLDDHLSTA